MTSLAEQLRPLLHPLGEAPRDADELLLASLQEQPDGSTYVSIHCGCWDPEIEMWVLGPRGSPLNGCGDAVSTHWLPAERLRRTMEERGR